jgi:DNA mismatch repair ATPase MutS
VKDSLEQGVSHFYAELEKLKRVLDLARSDAAGAELFLLDEILHGTNSRERILGARAILTELLRRGAMGAVSTHDLGISDLEAKLAAEGKRDSGDKTGITAKNVHFEEQVEGEKMTFDYRLRDGIVQSSNALRLMKLVGIDVIPEF